MISTTVPFRIPNVFQGLVLTEGILSVEGADLKLEFQTAYVLGLLKSGVREVRLPLDKIEEIRFVKTWLGRTVVVRVAEMRGAAEVPNSSGGGDTIIH